MKIVNMNEIKDDLILQAAQILTDSLPIGWPTLDDAIDEIKERLISENVLLAAVEDDEIIGWGGILPQYNCNVFELHPLAVKQNMRRKGVGAAIVKALEDAARSRGGITMQLGADDEVNDGETSFANVDLYDNLPRRIENFNPGTHQTSFYMKIGYKIIGVMPDANGIGKPDIYMGKRL
ncbi:GNAT family N-acetyltransferase [Tissierella sp. MB52-C2]|uniref:GNAT family N-acetyltransferase n=1 Tax=Tissierella sp. MB52-C2 TaxID=3070999 RepID=UPI00280B129E|nr:GNAT family N-acetyltransferase [Tissierella sp. MB52-C2]WMM24800.1 GNAT family N-acetyltransferase [Tissierella sp. MB52-C2]